MHENRLDLIFNLSSEQDTENLAGNFAEQLHGLLNTQSLIFTFSGELGTGKTTFIRAFLRALGIQGVVKSPTFTLVESYETPRGETIHHFDLYRIHEDPEIELPGFRDYFADKAVCCIEWPERAGDALKQIDLAFNLKLKGDSREVRVEAFSTAGNTLLLSLKSVLCIP